MKVPQLQPEPQPLCPAARAPPVEGAADAPVVLEELELLELELELLELELLELELAAAAAAAPAPAAPPAAAPAGEDEEGVGSGASSAATLLRRL